MTDKGASTAEEIENLKAEVDRLVRALDEATAALAGSAAGKEPPAEDDGSVLESAEEFGERVQEGLSDLQKRIDENPVPSALVAFAIGFLLGRVFTR